MKNPETQTGLEGYRDDDVTMRHLWPTLYEIGCSLLGSPLHTRRTDSGLLASGPPASYLGLPSERSTESMPGEALTPGVGFTAMGPRMTAVTSTSSGAVSARSVALSGARGGTVARWF